MQVKDVSAAGPLERRRGLSVSVFGALLGLLLLGTQSAHAANTILEVQDVVWGFDGHCVPNCYNPVSVLLKNKQKDKDFKGVLQFYQVQGLGRVGPIYAQDFYLPAKASRWVQFKVLMGVGGTYMMRWGPHPDDTVELSECLLGVPARVYLQAESGLISSLAGVVGFPETMFPRSCVLTSGLQQMVLDHKPDWDKLQCQAFVDWIRRGGIAHVLLRRDRERLRFTGPMSVLNVSKKIAFGDGLIVPHDKTNIQVTAKSLDQLGYPRVKQNRDSGLAVSGSDNYLLSVAGSLRPPPKHRWDLILIASVLFMLVIGPVNAVVARKSRSYLLSLSVFLVAVAATSYLFFELGKRGFGETATSHAACYARSLGGGRFDVKTWQTIFVTDGDEYQFEFECEQGYFSTISDVEAVRGVIGGGEANIFRANLPLYSSQEFCHRGTRSMPAWLKNSDCEIDKAGLLKTFRVYFDKATMPEIEEIFVVYNEHRLFRLQRLDDALYQATDFELKYGSTLNRGKFQMGYGWDQMFNEHRWSDYQYVEMSEAQRTRRVGEVLDEGLLHQCMDYQRPYQSTKIVADQTLGLKYPGRAANVELFVRCQTPESWRLKNWSGIQSSRTLFHFTVPIKISKTK